MYWYWWGHILLYCEGRQKQDSEYLSVFCVVFRGMEYQDLFAISNFLWHIKCITLQRFCNSWSSILDACIGCYISTLSLYFSQAVCLVCIGCWFISVAGCGIFYLLYFFSSWEGSCMGSIINLSELYGVAYWMLGKACQTCFWACNDSRCWGVSGACIL